MAVVIGFISSLVIEYDCLHHVHAVYSDNVT